MFSHRSSKDAPNCARRERLIVTARQRIVDGKLYSQACSLGASESSLDSCLPSRETACLQKHALCNVEYTSDTITRRRERERPGDNNQTAPQYLFVYTLPAACHKGRINLYAYQLALERALHFKCHRLGALEEEKEKLTIAYCAGLCWHSFLNFVFFYQQTHERLGRRVAASLTFTEPAVRESVPRCVRHDIPSVRLLYLNRSRNFLLFLLSFPNLKPVFLWCACV